MRVVACVRHCNMNNLFFMMYFALPCTLFFRMWECVYLCSVTASFYETENPVYVPCVLRSLISWGDDDDERMKKAY